MMLVNDIRHPLSVDEQNIELESAMIESEVYYATIRKPLSVSESILYAMWESYFSEHIECL